MSPIDKPTLHVQVVIDCFVNETEPNGNEYNSEGSYVLDYEFSEGRATFFSTPSKDFMHHLIENKKGSIPTINCSRDGTKCPTPITELQIHNEHVPKHYSLDSIREYVDRICADLMKATKEIDVELKTPDYDKFNETMQEVTKKLGDMKDDKV